MSYILDALQKSEHERRQKQHSVAVNPFEEQEFSPSRSKSLLPWVLVGILGCILAALAMIVGMQWPKAQTPPSAQVISSNERPVADQNPTREVNTSPSSQTTVAKAENTTVKSTTPESTTAEKQESAKVKTAPVAPASVEAAEPQPSAQAVKAPAVSSEVKRLYVKSEQRREREQQRANLPSSPPPAPPSAVEGASQAPAVGGDGFDTDAIVAAALTQLQGGTPPPEVPASNADDTVNVSSHQAATVDLTAKDEADSPQKSSPDASYNPSRFPAAAELPARVQKSLPSFKYTSHIYSSSSQKGFVIINGGKYIQGESVAPGLVIEKIQDEGVILSFGGHLFFQEAMTDWAQP